MTRHVLSLASGGAADVPGATGTREVSPTIISRGIFDARALRMAYAQGCAGMRTCEGAWGCARRGNAAHARRAHGRTRRGQQTRTRTCFRRDGFCSHLSESPAVTELLDSCHRTTRAKAMRIIEPAVREIMFPLSYLCWRMRVLMHWCAFACRHVLRGARAEERSAHEGNAAETEGSDGYTPIVSVNRIAVPNRRLVTSAVTTVGGVLAACCGDGKPLRALSGP